MCQVVDMATSSPASATANTVTIDDAKAQWDTLLAKVHGGEEWLITDASGQPVAKLAPAKPAEPPVTERWAAFGMMKGEIWVSPDFDEPLEDFKEYME